MRTAPPFRRLREGACYYDGGIALRRTNTAVRIRAEEISAANDAFCDNRSSFIASA
jgi:hypothetical protein